MAGRRPPQGVADDPPAAFDEALRLFDEQRFFEAHEFFEIVWKSPDVPAADRDFWKGVTQVAVGCVHAQRGNPVGAVTLLERAAQRLQPYPARHRGVRTQDLRHAALALAERVRKDGASPQSPFPTFPRAPDVPFHEGKPTDRRAGMEVAAQAGLHGLSPGKRYRCGGCGNLTRFDVVSSERIRRFWHLDLSGAGAVDEEEHLAFTIDSVTCRWCSSTENIEVVDAPDPSGAAESGAGGRG